MNQPPEGRVKEIRGIWGPGHAVAVDPETIRNASKVIMELCSKLETVLSDFEKYKTSHLDVAANNQKAFDAVCAEHEEQRLALSEAGKALEKNYPREGAWYSRCNMCTGETECGDIPHDKDCIYLLFRNPQIQSLLTKESAREAVTQAASEYLRADKKDKMYPEIEARLSNALATLKNLEGQT